MTDKIQNKVHQLLIQYEDMRDSDSMLIAWMWNLELEEKGYITSNLPAYKFLTMMSKGQVTSSESIRRVRQKLQADHKELRGKKYEQRLANQQKVKENLGYK